ncbi:hypothetical protein N1851_002317 [Merluccius polli]|uniref:HAT C-terminal dimerisation domain-containing protein n=1 Tax=Merluccius polli TaxID=89951 RepID=A0AA47PB50_MERPO|nr:hypothetical protein N1851_002317 [Merluccius polli]
MVCAVEMAKAFGDDNMVKHFETVSLSQRTVTCRLFDIHDHVEMKLRQVMHDCNTDVMDVSQLLIFTRTIDSSFEVHEELSVCTHDHIPSSTRSVHRRIFFPSCKFGTISRLFSRDATHELRYLRTPSLLLSASNHQNDLFFQAKRNERGISFWRLLPEARFPLLKDFALSMSSMFGRTYICESSFSTMKHIKSKERNRLTDDTFI